MTIRITSIMGDRRGSVDDSDRERAIGAAEAVCTEAGVTPQQAEAAYIAAWHEADQEDQMTGSARVWIDARKAADVALTSTWANPGAEVFCELGS